MDQFQLLKMETKISTEISLFVLKKLSKPNFENIGDIYFFGKACRILYPRIGRKNEILHP